MNHVVYQPKHKHKVASKVCECGKQQWGIAKLICESGQIKYPWYCRQCGKATAFYEPNHEWLIYTAVINHAGQLQCERCGILGAEWHHWAPRHIFGDECENWPQSPLCQICHTVWHQKVTPDMGKH